MGLSDLPDAPGAQHEKAFESLGWRTRRRAEHIVMTHPDVFGVTLAIPNHRIVKRTTLHKLVRAAGLTDAIYRRAFEAL
jgi:predicted RNA binding protein YcfA (HicA-like mRNA interferase family)